MAPGLAGVAGYGRRRIENNNQVPGRAWPSSIATAWVPGRPRQKIQFYLVHLVTDDGVAGSSAFPAASRERAGIGDPVFNEIFHPISRRLVARCDGCLRIGGASTGADEMVNAMVALARQNGKAVYYALADIPSPG